jgi:hypothetical protein
MFVHVWTMCAIAIPICTILAVFGDRASAAVHSYYESHRPHVHMPHMHLQERFHSLFHHKPKPSPTP